MHDIEITDLKKAYGQKTVFDNFNLTIKGHEFLLLSGESGAGKSTLLNMISGIEKPDSGSIRFGGEKIRPSDIGYVFQGFYLDSGLTIEENIELPGVFSGMKKKNRQVRSATLAKIFGITTIMKNKPTEVSGGQAERACIARAIFNNPKIILADEPTNNLDRKNAETILRVFKALWEKTSMTVIVASHDELVKRYSTKTIIVKGDGSCETY